MLLQTAFCAFRSEWVYPLSTHLCAELSFNIVVVPRRTKKNRQWNSLVWYQWMAMILLCPTIPNKCQYHPTAWNYDVIKKSALSWIIICVLGIGPNYVFTLIFCKIECFWPILCKFVKDNVYFIYTYWNLLYFSSVSLPFSGEVR